MGFLLKLVKWTLALALAAVFLFVGSAKLTPAVHQPTYTMMVKHFDALVKTKVYPYSQVPWTGETVRVSIGIVEVIFATLLLCPYYTRLSAFVFMFIGAIATYNTFSLHEPFLPLAGLMGAATLLFLVSGDAVARPATASSQKKKQ